MPPCTSALLFSPAYLVSHPSYKMHHHNKPYRPLVVLQYAGGMPLPGTSATFEEL